jgi:hypothetical protein
VCLGTALHCSLLQLLFVVGLAVGLFAEAVGRTLFAEAVCSPDGGDGQVSQVIPGAEVSTVLVYSFSPPFAAPLT